MRRAFYVSSGVREVFYSDVSCICGKRVPHSLVPFAAAPGCLGADCPRSTAMLGRF